ncbi:hypothetical protein PYCC9005_002351 [Savitreella phatthalungensis]
MAEIKEHSADDIQSFINHLGDETYDRNIVSASEVVSANGNEAVFRTEVRAGLVNSLGAMHGGAVATAIDLFTSCALVPQCRDGFWEMGPGVSRNLNVTYLRPAKQGTTILFKCKIVSLSKRTVYMTCEVVDEATGKILATGTHDKVAVAPPKL